MLVVIVSTTSRQTISSLIYRPYDLNLFLGVAQCEHDVILNPMDAFPLANEKEQYRKYDRAAGGYRLTYWFQSHNWSLQDRIQLGEASDLATKEFRL